MFVFLFLATFSFNIYLSVVKANDRLRGLSSSNRFALATGQAHEVDDFDDGNDAYDAFFLLRARTPSCISSGGAGVIKLTM